MAGLTDVLQEDLFVAETSTTYPARIGRRNTRYLESSLRARVGHPEMDVEHDQHGRGWVWGSGLGRVTVRFETRETPPGPVRTYDDPELHRVELF